MVKLQPDSSNSRPISSCSGASTVEIGQTATSTCGRVLVRDAQSFRDGLVVLRVAELAQRGLAQHFRMTPSQPVAGPSQPVATVATVAPSQPSRGAN
eukprot:gene12574-biopygen7315